MPRSQVIILNGVGSVGKTSTARAVQALAATPLLHVQMDAFLDMLPQAMSGHPDGMVFESFEEDGAPCVAIRTGPVADRALGGMRHAIAALAAQGNHLIVDDVMIGQGEAAEYRELLSAHDLHMVGLFAPLRILEDRERRRGDRQPGLARWQFKRVHRDVAYDLEIDTTELTPEDVARKICMAFGL